MHSQFSWDTGPHASMREACAEAVDLGLPGVAFTEHVDFTAWSAGDNPLHDGHRPRAPGYYAPVDLSAYFASVERCRDEFPGLVVRSGIETGEPHLFAGSVAEVLAAGQFQQVLGSLHSVVRDGELVGVGKVIRRGEDPDQVAREYFAELLTMVESSSAFAVLAHCDFPRRYWPSRHRRPYVERDYEDEYRAVFTALAASGRTLEVNTASPLASAELVRWWRECGGETVSFGSDAHVPWLVGQRFTEAVDVVTAAGFRAGDGPLDYYRR